MKILSNKRSIALCVLSTLLTIALACGCATVPSQPFPSGDWPSSTPEAQGMQSKVLADMMQDLEERSPHINSITVVRNGHMVLDAYFSPFPKGKRHIIHSCTKSVMSALIGIAIDQGHIKGVDQPIMEFFPDEMSSGWDDLKKTVTLEDLLTMRSGLKCEDSWKYRWAGLWQMKNSQNWAKHVLDLPMAATPGDKFEYCNGVSFLLSVIIQNTTKMQTLDFANQHLFGPLGITDIDWDQSPQGVDIGWGEMWLTPHDMAKFGWLYLNKGRWGDQQVVPAAWVEASTRPHLDANIFDHYGYQWWMDEEGYFMAVGYKGQRIFVVPDKNLVAVMTGDLTGKDWQLGRSLLNMYIVPSASSDKALPATPKELARLETLVAQVGQKAAVGYSWTSVGEGLAKDGLFTRTVAPAFRFSYPMGAKKSSLEYDNQIMRMKSPGDLPFSAFLERKPYALPLKDFAPRRYSRGLKQFGSDIEIISHRKVTLACGTPAYRTNIKWKWKEKVPLTTVMVSAYKDDKLVYVTAHPLSNVGFAEGIVDSLTFK